jgi:predicted TIM-barrel fold metal-dependent hydrolase
VLGAGYMGLPDDSNMAPENDFVSDEVSKYPDRLIGFCGINPRYDSAVSEIERCLALPGMVGVKLHLPGSGVDLSNEADVAGLAAVFDKVEEANAPLLMHVNDEHNLPLYGERAQAVFDIVSEHPDVRLVLAHCAGNADDQSIELWLHQMIGNMASLNAENLYVEISACLKFYKDAPLAKREMMVWRFRQWGIERVLFGSDYLRFLPEETPLETLDTLTRYPFTQQEINVILGNSGTAWLGR